MNIGSSASDLGLHILLLFPALLAPIVLLVISVLLGRALGLTGFWLLLPGFALIGGLLLGASVWLDSAGQTLPGRVERRTETLDLRPQGDWRHQLSVSVRYRLDGVAPLADQPAPDESATTLQLSQAAFDRLSEGGTTQLRVLPLYRSLALVRLADTGTRDVIPWTLVALLGGGLMALAVAGQLFRTTAGGIAVIIVTLVAVFAVPLGLSYRHWQAAEDIAAKPLRAMAEITEVTRITQIDPFPCTPGSGSNCQRRNTKYDVAQPYDIVRMRFTPQGAGGSVTTVDAVDAVGASAFSPGASVEIAYAVDNPRAAQIPGATHSHYWRNTLGLVLLFGAMATALAVGLWFLLRRTRRAMAGVGGRGSGIRNA